MIDSFVAGAGHVYFNIVLWVIFYGNVPAREGANERMADTDVIKISEQRKEETGILSLC